MRPSADLKYLVVRFCSVFFVVCLLFADQIYILAQPRVCLFFRADEGLRTGLVADVVLLTLAVLALDSLLGWAGRARLRRTCRYLYPFALGRALVSVIP